MRRTVIGIGMLSACISLWPASAPHADAGDEAAKASGIELSWWHLGGGGTTSSGGLFELTGTVGETAAGTSSGGSFVLRSGFLAQTTGLEDSIFEDGFESGSISNWSMAVGL